MGKTEIKIRGLQAKDIPNAMKLVYTESRNQTENDWEILVSGNDNVALAAEFEGQIVGTATAINYRNDVAWVGMVLVNKQ